MSVQATPLAHPSGDETYLDEAYLSIRWRSVPQILYAEWKGFATSAEFRAALLTGVRAIRERPVTGYVSDARKAKVFVTRISSGPGRSGFRRQPPLASNEWPW